MSNLDSLLGAIYVVSEISFSGAAHLVDRGSLSLLWTVIGCSVFLAFFVKYAVPALGFGDLTAIAQAVGAAVLFAGLALRWYAIIAGPILLTFLWRIRVEEAALLKGLGVQYQSFMDRTERLIPGIY